MNKCRAPKIPPILHNNQFILNCKEKASLFNDFFAKQCQPIQNSSSLPDFHYLTRNKINSVLINSDDILSLIRNVDPNKSNGPDLITGHMLQLSDKSIVLPLKLIFFNILKTGTYPLLWKLANVTPVHKKMTNRSLKTIDPSRYCPCAGKSLRK